MIFFSLFALVMIGGSFAVSFWIIHQNRNADPPFWGPHQAEMIQPEPEKDATGGDRDPRNDRKISWVLIITQMIGAICIVLLVGIRLKKKFIQGKPLTVPGYIFKITRLTDKSEHDVFFKAAEDWPVSKEQIEQDYKRFMLEERVPYYVNDFIRKNKKHIDQLPISIFQFNGFE